MKKILPVLLAVLLCLSGCGGNYIPYSFDVEEYLTLGKYKGVSYTLRPAVVTDDMMEEAIYDTMKEHGYGTETTLTTGAVSYGDAVSLSMKGYVGEKEDPTLAANNITITVGKGEYLDGIEEGLIGKKIGETSSLSVEFPEDYVKVAYAGKTVRYDVSIGSVVHIEMPELTDKIAQDISDSDTAEAFKETLSEQLKKQAVVEADDAAEQDVWNAVLADCKADKYPEKEIKLLSENCKRQFKEKADESGKDFSAYIESIGLTQEEYDAYELAYAQRLCKENMAIYAIARNEGIEASKTEIGELAKQYADNYGYKSISDLYKTYPEYMLKQDILIQKVKDFVLSAATAK